MRPQIPLEILATVGPILSWVEGAASQSLPKGWLEADGRSKGLKGWLVERRFRASEEQEQGWLLGELPTYSLDNIDDLVAFERDMPRKTGRVPKRGHRRSSLSPSSSCELVRLFEKLEARYLCWYRGKLSIQSNRMVELHELGLRLPLSLLVRFCHAKAIGNSSLTIAEATECPESMSLLPYSAHGLRAVTRRGLSEGHLHMNAIHATEVAWADHLLKPMLSRTSRFPEVEWRLSRLGRVAARLLAVAVGWCRGSLDPAVSRTRLGEHRTSVRARFLQWLSMLLEEFDQMYLSTSEFQLNVVEERLLGRLDQAVRFFVSPSEFSGTELWPTRPWEFRDIASANHSWSRDSGRLGLLIWLDPHQSTDHWVVARREYGLTLPRSPFERESLLSSLHLAALIELNRYSDCSAPERYSKFDSESERELHTGRGGDRARRFQFLHSALYRYLVSQAHFWQMAVQQGQTTGLRRFREFYSSEQRYPVRPSPRQSKASVLNRIAKWRGLRVLEGRVAPPSGKLDLQPWIEEVAALGDRRPMEKFGLVIHFIKEAEKRRGTTEEAARRSRFAENRVLYRRQAFGIFRILERPTAVNPFIVGIDAANLELVTPPEAFASVFHFLRDEPIALRASETVDPVELELEPHIRKLVQRRHLGMTYHAGEEFRHLLSGLRAIDEVIQFLDPKPGDRLGHGIALALDPAIWMDQVGGQALVPQQEWLDTLVWVLRVLGAGDPDVIGLEIEADIERLCREIYPPVEVEPRRTTKPSDKHEHYSPVLLYDAWKLRQLDPVFSTITAKFKLKFQPLSGCDVASVRWNRVLRRRQRTLERQVGNVSTIRLLDRYWHCEQARRVGEQLYLVDMESKRARWIGVCQRAQAVIQQRFIDRQMILEVNPSANRIIGPMGRLSEHPVFDLTFDRQTGTSKDLRVSINTDNPGTANTSLAHEYFLLGETLISQGRSEQEVMDWLETLRRTGKESSFLFPMPSRNDESMRKVYKKLGERRFRPSEYRDPNESLAALLEKWPTQTASEKK